jgi:hypothetical protein
LAKTRVSALARSYGITSKEVLERLSAIGIFAKSPASTIELPDVHAFEKAYPRDSNPTTVAPAATTSDQTSNKSRSDTAIRVRDLAAKHGLSPRFVIDYLTARFGTSAWAPNSTITGGTISAFEAEWADKAAAMTAEERAGLQFDSARRRASVNALHARHRRPSPGSRAPGTNRPSARRPVPADFVTVASLMRDTETDWTTAREVLKEMNGPVRPHQQPQTVWLSPRDAAQFRERAQQRKASEPQPDAAPPPSLDVLFSNAKQVNPSPSKPSRKARRSRSATDAERLNHLPLGAAAEVLRAESRRGKRHHGAIDLATMQWLDRQGVTDDPPFLDQYDRAFEETRHWRSVGFLSDELTVRWREHCWGIDPEVAFAFQQTKVPPRAAATRWGVGYRPDPDGPVALWELCMPDCERRNRMSVDRAIRLLRHERLVA